MVYEVISPRGRGTGNIVGVHTESPQCIDSLDMQKAMVAGGSKITFPYRRHKQTVGTPRSSVRA